MLKNWMRDVTLAVQARSGFTPALLVWFAILGLALLTAFTFLCVTAYDWVSQQLGAVYAGLIMAGVFILIALIALLGAVMARRRAKARAILERAARAHASSWLLDPKILGVALQAGRTLGWERIVPLALLGFLAAQWARDRRTPPPDDGG
jgi:hypothetical protein